MRRILIIGCGGSGKSTLGVRLGEKLGLPVVHLDRLFWRAGWTHISRDEFDAALAQELAKPAWIIEGDYTRTLETRLRACDTVIQLDYPRIVCLWGILRRRLRYRHATRPDMARGCPEKIDADFFQWVWTYKAKNGQEHAALLREAEARGVRVLAFKSRRQCERWVRTL